LQQAGFYPQLSGIKQPARPASDARCRPSAPVSCGVTLYYYFKSNIGVPTTLSHMENLACKARFISTRWGSAGRSPLPPSVRSWAPWPHGHRNFHSLSLVGSEFLLTRSNSIRHRLEEAKAGSGAVQPGLHTSNREIAPADPYAFARGYQTEHDPTRGDFRASRVSAFFCSPFSGCVRAWRLAAGCWSPPETGVCRNCGA